VSRSIAVLGAGPALGRAVARRYAEEGYEVALVARRREPLEQLAGELTSAGATAYAVPGDLSDTAGVASLAQQIRDKIGDPDALYYGPTAGGSALAADPTPEQIQAYMPCAVYSLVALVREFVPHMIEQRHGAILLATGASAVQGTRNFRGPGPALAAQRNYLQSLQAEVAEHGVYVGRLYIGATIAGSTWHSRAMAEEAAAEEAAAEEAAAEEAAGRPARTRGPVVDPAHLAGLLWEMHQTGTKAESIYPQGIFSSTNAS
jgi:short-subunit dehydrogenase